jgi:hypothetical protein
MADCIPDIRQRFRSRVSMMTTASNIAAYLVLVVSGAPNHQGVDAIRHPNMRSCMMQLEIMARESAPNRAVILDGPKCTQTKPSWWRD